MRNDIFLSLILALIFAAALFAVQSYRWQVAIAPALAAGIGLFLVSLQLLKSVRQSVDIPRKRSEAATELGEIAWFLLAVLSVILLGFAIGGGFFVFAYVLALQQGQGGIWKAAMLAAPVPVVVYLLFEQVLQIRLFPGLLLD